MNGRSGHPRWAVLLFEGACFKGNFECIESWEQSGEDFGS